MSESIPVEEAPDLVRVVVLLVARVPQIALALPALLLGEGEHRQRIDLFPGDR